MPNIFTREFFVKKGRVGASKSGRTRNLTAKQAKEMVAAREKKRKKVQILIEALEAIVALQPCLNNGGCFYPMHDGDGNYIGGQEVNPLGVIERMAQIAQEALSNTR